MNREDFPMLKNDIIYFDNGATTFKPKCVIDEVSNYYLNLSVNSHRGDYDLCFANDSKVAEARHVVGHFINALDKEIVFTSGTTMSINFIALGYAAKYLTNIS